MIKDICPTVSNIFFLVTLTLLLALDCVVLWKYLNKLLTKQTNYSSPSPDFKYGKYKLT